MAYKDLKDPRYKAARLRHYIKNKAQYFVRNKKKRLEIKLALRKRKSRGCLLCPEKEVVALDLHHLKDKVITPSEMILKGWGLQRVKSEMDKCIVLCANCHRKVTFNIIKLN